MKKQSDLKYTKWSRINTEIVTWDPSKYGDSMLYTWLEDDGGGSTTNSSTFSSKFNDNATGTFTTSYTVPKTHTKMGESIVEYCDFTTGDGRGYNTGSITFSVNQL